MINIMEITVRHLEASGWIRTSELPLKTCDVRLCGCVKTVPHYALVWKPVARRLSIPEYDESESFSWKECCCLEEPEVRNFGTLGPENREAKAPIASHWRRHWSRD